MSDRKQFLYVLTLCVLLLVTPLGTTTELIIPETDRESVPATSDFWQMVPDPYLETEPDAFVMGTSGEFLYDYDNGTMHLNWTHTAGTELDFLSADDDTYPSFHDFVYFSQSFNWPYEDKPIDAIGNVNWSIQYPLSLHSLYYDVYVWLIDSSGHWKKIHPSSRYDHYQFNLNSEEIEYAWGGMIEDEFGVQEDPEDILTIGVGLAPTHYFDYNDGEEIWQTYTGSINVSIYSIDLCAIMDVESDPATHLSPLFNMSFASDIHDLYPFYQGNITQVWDRQLAMTNDTYGNIYLTGQSGPSYEIYLEQNTRVRHQFIIKYDPSLNRKWVIRNLNNTAGRAITYHDGYLYTSGLYEPSERNYNVLLTKWDLAGRKIWENEWGGQHDQIGVALGVHKDGSIYVMVSDCNSRSEGPYWNTSLLKFNERGNLIWNKSLPLSTLLDLSTELWVFDSHIFHSFREEIMCIDLEGNVLWQKDSRAAACDESGNVYTAHYIDNPGINITKLDFSGNEIWSDIYEIEYPIDFTDIQTPLDMIVTPSNELLVLLQGHVDRTYRLLSYSLNGTHTQTWTIGDSIWPIYQGGAWCMESTSTGLLYFSYENTWTQAYVIGPYTIPDPEPPTFPTHLVLSVGGGIGVVALVGFYAYRKKRR